MELGHCNYRDLGDVVGNTCEKKRQWTEGQEYEPDEEGEEEWGKLSKKDLQQHLLEADSWGGEGQSACKGKKQRGWQGVCLAKRQGEGAHAFWHWRMGNPSRRRKCGGTSWAKQKKPGTKLLWPKKTVRGHFAGPTLLKGRRRPP